MGTGRSRGPCVPVVTLFRVGQGTRKWLCVLYVRTETLVDVTLLSSLLKIRVLV